MTEAPEAPAVAGDVLVGRALTQWRHRTGCSQKEIAQQAGVTRSYLSKLERGRKRPSPQVLLSLTQVFRRNIPNWSVAEAVDGWLLLGVDWQTFDDWLVKAPQPYTEFRALRRWWRSGRPTVAALPAPTREAPLFYVERAVQASLRRRLQAWADYRRLRYPVHMVWGRGGMGKTTLVHALLAEPEVRRFFRDGWFWIDAAQGDPQQWVRDLCRQAGLQRREQETWRQVWQRWTAAPEHRALVVLDDVVADTDLQALLEAWGPQMQLLVTTQHPDAVWLNLRRVWPAKKLQEYALPPLNDTELQALAAQLLSRVLNATAWATLTRTRWTLGRSPSVLLPALADVRQYGWSLLEHTAAQRRLTHSIEAVQRHLHRVRRYYPFDWQRLHALVKASHGGWPFSSLFAAVVWIEPRPQARRLLRRLNRLGLVECLNTTQSAPPLWYLDPVARRTLRRSVDPSTGASQPYAGWKRRASQLWTLTRWCGSGDHGLLQTSTQPVSSPHPPSEEIPKAVTVKPDLTQEQLWLRHAGYFVGLLVGGLAGSGLLYWMGWPRAVLTSLWAQLQAFICDQAAPGRCPCPLLVIMSLLMAYVVCCWRSCRTRHAAPQHCTTQSVRPREL